MHSIKSYDGRLPKNYVPPLIGNGSLSLIVDDTGAQSQKVFSDYGSYFGKLVPMIWWAGRRYNDPLKRLIPYGHFEVGIKINGEDISKRRRKYWEQELKIEEGYVATKSNYEDIEDVTTTFIALDHNLIVVNKKVGAKKAKDKIELTFSYVIHKKMNPKALPDDMEIYGKFNHDLDAIEVNYRVNGNKEYRGSIIVFSDPKVSLKIYNNKYCLHASSYGNIDITFYLLFMDNHDDVNYASEMLKLVNKVNEEGYLRVFDKHRSSWRDFWNHSYVSLPDKDLADVWKTCLYHIRSQLTKWSIPVGILDTHWWGKFFHDELFPYLALVSSNHLELAERIPNFRYQTLGKALIVTGGKGARYPWESTEEGDEGAPPGPWLYEIHHIATIALECWLHYAYSQDLNFLKKIYEVIKQCAEYLRLWHVYEVNDKAFIGTCTDLDESISAVKNPIYTCCGTIRTFLIAYEASKILGVDKELRVKWERLARKLLDNMPYDGDKYVPFEGASHQSLGALGIVFPFEVLDPKDERARRTILDYMNRCKSTVGWRPTSRSEKDAFFVQNLFSEDVLFVGEGENWIWNSAWLATCLAKMQLGDMAYDVLRKIIELVDNFGSVSEAKTSKRTVHHWFTTAAGSYVYALNEMLVQSNLSEIKLFPAVPSKWRDLSFKLRCQGNIVIEAKIVNGKIGELIMESPLKTLRKVTINENMARRVFEKSGGDFIYIGEEKGMEVFKAAFQGSLRVKFK